MKLLLQPGVIPGLVVLAGLLVLLFVMGQIAL